MIKEHALSNLIDVYETLKEIGIESWLNCGTLLGAIREKDFISYDIDIDLGILSENFIYEKHFSILKEKLEKLNFEFLKKNVALNNIFEYKFRRYDINIDLFIYYINKVDRIIPNYNGDEDFHLTDVRSHYCINVNDENDPITCDHPRYVVETLIENEFLGHNFLIPKYYDEYLSLSYGNWKIEKKDFHWWHDILNKRKLYKQNVMHQIKRRAVERFLKYNVDIDKINNVYDVGCKYGQITSFLQEQYNKNVLGVDKKYFNDIPISYNFKKIDIVKNDYVYFNDITIFFSLYHIILGQYGIEIADDIFYKLLLRTKYLLFDSGNVSEKNISHLKWYKEQQKYFKNEKELLDHFNIKYDVLSFYNMHDGYRTIVVFYSNDFVSKCKTVKTYKRKTPPFSAKCGLIEKYNTEKDIFEFATFKKIEFNNKLFFVKQYEKVNRLNNEYNNVPIVYNTINQLKLINFYGYIKNFGFIYEWIDNFKHIENLNLKLNEEMYIQDVELIFHDGVEKYIDFNGLLKRF